MNFRLFSFLLLLTIWTLAESRLQCITVRGRAKCGLGQDEDAPPIFIKLVDEDSGK